MSQVLKLRFSFLAAALVLSAGVSLVASDAFAAASSAAAAGAPGAASGGTGTGGGATGNGGGATGTGGGAPPRCGAACNPPHRIAYDPARPHSACAHREPAFDRFGRYVGEIIVNSCFANE
jgi:hypothetical protein